MMTTTASSPDLAETGGSSWFLMIESIAIGESSLSDFNTVSNPLFPTRMSSSLTGSFLSSSFICWETRQKICKI